MLLQIRIGGGFLPGPYSIAEGFQSAPEEILDVKERWGISAGGCV